MNDRSTLILGKFLFLDCCVYLRPYVPEGDVVWRVTVEKTGRQLIYVVTEDEDLDEAIKQAYIQVRKKLGIKRRRKA